MDSDFWASRILVAWDLGMVSSVSMHILSLHEWSVLKAARAIRGSCRDWLPHFNGILSMNDRVFLESFRTSSVVLTVYPDGVSICLSRRSTRSFIGIIEWAAS